jgi:hypothetical protein
MDDGKLDANELGKMVALAESDGEITQEEIHVLRSVIKRIKPEEVDSNMKSRLDSLSKKISI